MSIIKRILNPENQYYLLCIPPLVVFIMIIFIVKSIKNGNIKDLIKFSLLYLAVFGILGVLVPGIIENYLGFANFSDSPAFAYYYTFIMVFFGIFLIKKQTNDEEKSV